MRIAQRAATMAVVACAVLGLAAPAHATLILTSGPNQGNFTNNFGFGSNGVGTAANPNANYYVGGTFGSHLNNAPVPILFVFGPSGAVSTYQDKTVGAYDNVEDTQIGVLNLTGKALTGFGLLGPKGFVAFDGDGISEGHGGYATGAGAPGNSKDPSHYGGPLAYYTLGGPGPNGFSYGGLSTSVYVNFINGGLASGSSTYFSLELDPNTLGHNLTVNSPEPTSMALAATSGVCTLCGFGWKRWKRGKRELVSASEMV